MFGIRTKEHRKETRYKLEVGYLLEIEGTSYYGITGNISTGGVFLRTVNKPLVENHIGKVGTLTLETPYDKGHLFLKCVLVHSILKGIGIKFQYLTADDIESIDNLMEGCPEIEE